MEETKRPSVGVGTIIIKDGKVLLGRRSKQTGYNTWSFGGGHIEFGESIEDCARREVLEEWGIRVKNPKVVTITSDVFKKEGRHFITIFCTLEYESGEVKPSADEFFQEWGWFKWEGMPKPLFYPIESLLKTGYSPF